MLFRNFVPFVARGFEVSSSVSAAGEDLQTVAAALHALYGILAEVPLKSWPCRSAVTRLSIAAVSTLLLI